MTSTLCTCTWLLLPCCVLVALSTGELDFYRGEIPESSESIALRQLIRYLEGQRPRTPPSHKRHYEDLKREKERDLYEALMDKGSLPELLRKPKEWDYQRIQYNDPPINELKPARERYVPFYESKPPVDSPSDYSDPKLSNFPSDSEEDDMNFPDDGYGYNDRASPLGRSYEETNSDRGMKEEPLQEFLRNYGFTVDQDGKNDGQMPGKPSEDFPDFTYRFDPPNLRERHPFAVKPNNPKYYEDDAFFLEDSEKLATPKPSNDTKWEGTVTEKVHAAREGNSRLESKFKKPPVILVPEIERRTEYNPVFVPVNQDLNNDIYGFAVVAGCTAASVFLLVLIALTWYRIHRSTKDAADIEYPAYGVTGPNKEISPSGDQRLAQSAQMYHFQHQKQQIIAMEKNFAPIREYCVHNDLCSRVSASRDPGSVSEADSDEENEEGDYTVYECPGLASTGEMEVKNPLFHDDPTPATPAQINKEEDHNI